MASSTRLVSPDGNSRTVLWWGRGDRNYSRDAVIRQSFHTLGWQSSDFAPRISRLGHLEAWLRRLPEPAVVWTPCFQHADVGAASRWCRPRKIPLIFDPLISTYDKLVFERRKHPVESQAALRLLDRERRLLALADVVVADTQNHADFYAETLQVPRRKLSVIPVGAEETVFTVQPRRPFSPPLRVLFYGSYIGLQSPETIVRAARLAPTVHWTMLGEGPLLSACRQQADGLANVEFVPWVPYKELPSRIAAADLVLGVFGSSDKAGRVIPNKVFQPLACGRPVVTRQSSAYPPELHSRSFEAGGVAFVPPDSPEAIADAVLGIAANPSLLESASGAARATYDEFFCSSILMDRLAATLELVQSGATRD
jgi:glycosyltransferase involved in cell wall biosynthesis